MERSDHRYAAATPPADQADDTRPLDMAIVEIADRLREISAELGSADRLFALADQLSETRQYDQARGVTCNVRAVVATVSEVMAVEVAALGSLARTARGLALDLANERAAHSLRVVVRDSGGR